MRVRFADTDAQGIAHNASFMVWLELTRVAYLAEHAGGYRAIRAQGIEAPTTEVHGPLSPRPRTSTSGDDLSALRRLAWSARFRYEYAIERTGSDGTVELVAEGHTLHATVDASTHLPTRVPAWFVEAIARAEG